MLKHKAILQGILYIVPTPIGNLKDITFRAIEVLKDVDFILAEDTRQTKKLLQHYDIDKQMYAHHKFNEHETTKNVINKLKAGENIALVSDGGTPAISDPGFFLARACIDEQIEVQTLPGAVALIPALVNSGLATDKFVFEGFLPHKKGRKTRLEFLAQDPRTVIFYESPHRIIKTLEQIQEHFGEERKVTVSRELTKKFEETLRGTAQELVSHFKQKAPKGEIVLVVEGKSKEVKTKRNKYK
ncbi:MAG: 16S rRNA (cytidine(1402)-2'-O)-methyltransferase [Chitinophagales bacterium]